MGRYFIILKFSNFSTRTIVKPTNSLDPPPPHGHVLHHFEIFKYFYHKCLNQVFHLTPHEQVLHHYEIFNFFYHKCLN